MIGFEFKNESDEEHLSSFEYVMTGIGILCGIFTIFSLFYGLYCYIMNILM